MYSRPDRQFLASLPTLRRHRLALGPAVRRITMVRAIAWRLALAAPGEAEMLRANLKRY